ncbi:hypothetical protein EDB19DRAFT_1836435 [Suillus lakei]|nr:hypothetical protein EDB19DRAFT_1836435 [Suillus lakei]
MIGAAVLVSTCFNCQCELVVGDGAVLAAQIMMETQTVGTDYIIDDSVWRTRARLQAYAHRATTRRALMSIPTTKLVLQQTLKDATNVIIRDRPTPEITVDRKLGEGGYNEYYRQGFQWHELHPWTYRRGKKLFKGWGKFLSNRCYLIGPYKTIEEYILACYDKEMYYYTHAPASNIDSDLFEHMSQGFCTAPTK